MKNADYQYGKRRRPRQIAGLEFLLATVGIYSVLAYSVRSRVHEIDVRIALGAQPADVVRLVVAED